MVLRQWADERPDLDASPMAIVGRLSRLSRMVDNALTDYFAEHGLDRASVDVLFTLRRSGSPYRLTPSELTRSSMVTSGAITQRLDRLEARGLIARRRSEADGRGVVVALTDEGHELTEAVLPGHLDNERRLFDALTPSQRDTFARTLRKVLESLGDKTD
ncbi:DNA-binding MarR family transcriptional regulator [Herbihabitans rhizosphaerae]|uniref:DNA-binding MarR family transcriptional regulator n=2 Tax=Herbihabitans rhizosphaerae TaxID=1872711 RepID=A0A4Q7KGI7_9PSEU|nr:DNA-binding MarR family transcriptional regulator [Herbihabitans rhizosphaerae]